MKETTVKISVTEDGLLPEEVTVLGPLFLPAIQKQILKSCGFEKIDERFPENFGFRENF